MNFRVTPPAPGALAARLAALGIAIETRGIAPGDEAAFPDPSEPLSRRRASGAARLAARVALRRLGGPADAPLRRAAAGHAVWPQNFVGSLAHDDALAVAVAAHARDVAALGVDVEPAEALPAEVADIALLPSERRACAADAALSRAVFAAKEAVYKAVHPRDGAAPEYEEIEVDLAGGFAAVRGGRVLRIEVGRGERFLVVAYAR